jgi:hypothetical protein
MLWLTESRADHAVSASTVYLIRSLGTVWGVSITSAIVQTTLSVRLPDALGEISDKWRVHSPCQTPSHFSPFTLTIPEEVLTTFWHRSSTRSATPSRQLETCRLTCSLPRVMSTTTVCDTPLRRRRPSRRWRSCLRCLPRAVGCEAPSDARHE